MTTQDWGEGGDKAQELLLITNALTPGVCARVWEGAEKSVKRNVDPLFFCLVVLNLSETN